MLVCRFVYSTPRFIAFAVAENTPLIKATISRSLCTDRLITIAHHNRSDHQLILGDALLPVGFTLLF